MPKAIHQGEYIDVLLRPTMVGLLRCGKMLPPQLNLVLEIEFADAETALVVRQRHGPPGQRRPVGDVRDPERQGAALSGGPRLGARGVLQQGAALR